MKDNIGFLIADVSQLMRRRFDERARSLGSTRAQAKVLLALDQEEGLNQGALAERVEVEPITLCRMIDRLAEAGLVERRPDPADRRAWRIFLTDRAAPLIVRLRELAGEMIEAALVGVAAERREELAEALRTIHANLNHPTVATLEARHG